MSNNVIDNLTSVVIKAVERKVMAVKSELVKNFDQFKNLKHF